ncbi:MAG TPA: hypothetical protein PLP23_16755 [Panacibacter sp.]|nr:hypothetical protein [Panacibacter sp.]
MKSNEIKYCKKAFIGFFSAMVLNAHAQSKIVAFDFEKPMPLNEWWVDNNAVKLSQCDATECKQLHDSKKCLKVEYNNISLPKPYVWLTDIKIDTFGNNAMRQSWNRFKDNTWLSFQINTADADSIYLQFVVFTKDEKDKWGSHAMTGFKNNKWKMIKVKLSNIDFDNWGNGKIARPDFNRIIPARIEIGIRSAYAGNKNRTNVRLDNVMLSNYEP